MPYNALAELPDAVKKMPKHAQEIYMGAFNGAWEQYKDRGNQREALSHATAWAAVEKQYEKKNGRWVAKESQQVGIIPSPSTSNISISLDGEEVAKMTKVLTNSLKEAIMASKLKEAELSDENKRQLLQTALHTEYKLDVDNTIPRSVWIEDIFEGHLIYTVNGQSYKAAYKLDEDGTAIFGEPEKVVAQKVYKSMESLRTTYSEIIQEAGKRNALKDAARVKKILELCQELLSSEIEPEEKKAKEALKEATSILTLLKEQAVVKTEDGIKFPAAAYAYVPDAESASTWKLRLWEDLEKKVTRAQLGRAAAALSPGGFRGQKVAIPFADLSAVKRKIRTEYRKLDVEDEDIPRWVKETMTRELSQNYEPLTEAKFDRGRATVVVIRAGFNADKSRYYPAEMLKRDYKVFEGMKMYADHPTEEEEKELPERSVKSGGWVATLKDVTCDENGTVTGVADIIETWLMQKLALLRDKGMLSEMGVSINALGNGSKATIEGNATVVIEEFTGCRSVDFVTEAGAGGNVTLYESDRNRDVDLVELSALKEKRPDLIKAIESAVRAEITKEVKKAMENEDRIKELEGNIETLTTERDSLKEAAEKAEKDKAKAEAQATIKEAVDKAELPDAAKERLVERFKDAESADGIEEAIKSEVDYIAKLSEAGKVKGLGPTKVDSEKDHKALVESFKGTGMSDEEAETAAKGR